MKSLRRNKGVAILCAAVAIAIMVVGVLYSAGWRYFVIEGGSMRPTYEVGTVIFTKPVAVEELQRRDIITYTDPRTERVTTHTFIEQAEDGSLVTRGDANPSLDNHRPALTANHVIGKVWAASAIPVASAEFWFTNPRGIGILVISALLLLLFVPGKRREKSNQSKVNESDKVLLR